MHFNEPLAAFAHCSQEYRAHLDPSARAAHVRRQRTADGGWQTLAADGRGPSGHATTSWEISRAWAETVKQRRKGATVRDSEDLNSLTVAV